MDKCSATKPNGERCTLPANGQHGLCWAHDPRNREKRRRTASRGGRGKAGGREVRDLKAEIKDLISNVKTGEVSPTRGNTMLRGYSVIIDLIKLERGVLEVEDLAARIEELQRGHSQKTS
jgi:hypothetical protein